MRLSSNAAGYDMTDRDYFDKIADQVEASVHHDLRILVEKDYENKYHIDVEEIDEDYDPSDDWSSEYTGVAYKVFDNLKEAAEWLKEKYL